MVMRKDASSLVYSGRVATDNGLDDTIEFVGVSKASWKDHVLRIIKLDHVYVDQ